MRRACSVDVKRSQCTARAAAVEALALDQPPDRRRHELADVLAAVEPRAQVARRDRERLELEEEHALGRREPREHRLGAARAGSPGRVATPSRARAQHLASAPSSRESRRTRRRRAGRRARPTPGWSRSRSTVRACSSSTTSSSGNAARASSSRVAAGVSTACAPGSAATSDEHRVEPERSFAARERARRGRRAAGRTRRRRAPITARARTSRSPISTSAPVRAPAARSARSSSSSLGGVPTTRKPRSVRSRRHGPRLRLRPVDEEVGELVLAAGVDRLGLGRRARTGARRKSSIPSPVAHESGEHRDDARRRRSRTAAASGARSILFSTTICGRSSSPAP